MPTKERFILQAPYYLATSAGNKGVRMMYAFCFLLLICGYYVLPLFGSLLAIFTCLLIWQVFGMITKHSKKYNIYNYFLLQRLLICALFVVCIFIYCSSENGFDYNMWRILILIPAVINVTDLVFSIKGLIGFGYISFGKDD